MFKNLFSWTDESDYYNYDDTRPEWNVDTAASPVIRYPQGMHQVPTVVSTPVLVKHPDQMKPRPSPVPTPRIVSVETPVHVERRIDHNQMQPTPMVRVQVPPALEYKVMEFWVPLCCEGCQDRVRKKLRYVRGVDRVDCDLHWKKVTVQGYAIPAEVLRQLQKLFKRSDYWTPPVVIVQKTQGGPSRVVEQRVGPVHAASPRIVEQRVGPVHGRH